MAHLIENPQVSTTDAGARGLSRLVTGAINLVRAISGRHGCLQAPAPATIDAPRKLPQAPSPGGMRSHTDQAWECSIPACCLEKIVKNRLQQAGAGGKHDQFCL